MLCEIGHVEVGYTQPATRTVEVYCSYHSILPQVKSHLHLPSSSLSPDFVMKYKMDVLLNLNVSIILIDPNHWGRAGLEQSSREVDT